MDDGPVGALRVTQLDAAELDQELVQLTKSQVSQLFKYHQFALYDSNATVGQQILGIHYGLKNSKLGATITGREKILYGLLMIVCPWLKERLSTLLTYLGLSEWNSKFHQWLTHAETVVNVAALINVLVFLKKGVYLTLLERIVGIRSMFPQRQGLRQVGFEYMTRELLWHGFSEFLFFLLPLINFQRIKNTVTRWVGSQRSSDQGHLKHRSKVDLMTCAICEESPVAPREIGCRHVFCYYCIAANLLADPNYTCPQCGHPVITQSNVQAVKMHINPGQTFS